MPEKTAERQHNRAHAKSKKFAAHILARVAEKRQ
jgi:hypothetical protein